MAKLSGANVVIFIFLVLVIAMIFVALIGYLSGSWGPYQ